MGEPIKQCGGYLGVAEHAHALYGALEPRQFAASAIAWPNRHNVQKWDRKWAHAKYGGIISNNFNSIS